MSTIYFGLTKWLVSSTLANYGSQWVTDRGPLQALHMCGENCPLFLHLLHFQTLYRLSEGVAVGSPQYQSWPHVN